MEPRRLTLRIKLLAAVVLLVVLGLVALAVISSSQFRMVGTNPPNRGCHHSYAEHGRYI